MRHDAFQRLQHGIQHGIPVLPGVAAGSFVILVGKFSRRKLQHEGAVRIHEEIVGAAGQVKVWRGTLG